MNPSTPPIVVQNVITRLMVATGVTTEADLAERLGVARNTLSTWRKRNSVPFEECVEIAVACGVTLDWLILGRGGAPPGPAVEPQDASQDAVLGRKLGLGALRLQARRGAQAGEWGVLRCLAADAPRTPSAIAKELRSSVEDVAGDLANLEVRGLVVRQGAGFGLAEPCVRLEAQGPGDVSQQVNEALELLATQIGPRAMRGQRAKLLTATVLVPAGTGTDVARQMADALRSIISNCDERGVEEVKMVFGVAAGGANG